MSRYDIEETNFCMLFPFFYFRLIQAFIMMVSSFCLNVFNKWGNMVKIRNQLRRTSNTCSWQNRFSSCYLMGYCISFVLFEKPITRLEKECIWYKDLRAIHHFVIMEAFVYNGENLLLCTHHTRTQLLR